MLTFRDRIKDNDPEIICKIAASTGFFDSHNIQLNHKLALKTLTEPDSGCEFILAESDKNPIAYVCFGPLQDAQEGTYEIFWLATMNCFRGCGVGHQLIEYLMNELKKRGIQKLYVKTDSTEQYRSTRHFYEKCGFKKEAVLKNYYGGNDDCCIYTMNFPAMVNSCFSAAE